MKPSLSVTGKTCEIPAAAHRNAKPIQRLLHQRGSLIKPKAASTLNAPNAQVNQCDAAASGTGTPIPKNTQMPWLRKNQPTRAAAQTSNVGPQPQRLRKNNNRKYAR